MNDTRKPPLGHVKGHAARIWRRRYLVWAITALAALTSFVSAWRSGTTYTAMSALITVSSNRSPEQDGILARGYVAMFSEPTFHQTLRDRADVPDGVTLTAITAAASPIILVSATSTDDTVVEAAAKRGADEFRRAVNASLRESRIRTITEMRQAFDEVTARTDGTIRAPALIQLQDRINAITANHDNQLETLQLTSGLKIVGPATARTVGVCGVAGLILGCALAWAAGFLSRRVRDAYDLEEKTGIEPLAVISANGRGTAEFEERGRVAQLEASVALADVPAPAVFAVTPVRSTAAAYRVAHALARFRAAHGVRTVLVDVDPGGPSSRTSHPGGQSLLDGRVTLTGTTDDQFRELLARELFAVVPGDDTRDLLSPERLRPVIGTLRTMADLVMICAPAAISARSPIVCAAADRTLLVVEAGTSADDVLAARDLLETSGVVLLGVVLVDAGSNPRPWRPLRPVGGGWPGAGSRREPGTSAPDRFSPELSSGLEATSPNGGRT